MFINKHNKIIPIIIPSLIRLLNRKSGSTDSPYLAPEPHRGEQNSPKNILDIALFVASIYDITLEELAKTTNENIRHIFDI